MKELRFIQISDTHLLSNKDDRLHNIEIRKVALNILDAIENLKLKVDFILHTGDISENGSQLSYNNAKEIFSLANIPVFWLPGNHDNLTYINLINNGKNILPLKSFDKNGVNFILLNSVAIDNQGKNRNRGYLSSNELKFLKEELQNNISQINVIALHHPPIKSGTWKDERMLENSKDFFELINQFGNVNLVLYGHQHQCTYKKIDNISFYSPPAASFQFDKDIKWGFGKESPGFGLITITNKENIECKNHYLNMNIEPIFNSNTK